MRLVWLNVVFALAAQAQTLFPVSGVIVDDGNDSPLPAQVDLLESNGKVHGSVHTASDGRFNFSVPAGHYVLRGGPRNRPVVTFGVGANSGFGSAIIAGPGKPTEDLTLRWFPPGAITGRITDETGEPVETALVQLVRASTVAGNPEFQTALWDYSNDQGEYRFFNVRPGKYYLAVTGQPWYAKAQGRLNTLTVGFQPSFYPNAHDPRKASPLVLRPGEEERADFSLTPLPGGTVEVHIENGSGVTGLINLVNEGIGGTRGFERNEHYNGGPTYTFAGVTPGCYAVRLDGKRGDVQVQAMQTVDVSGSQSTVQIDPRPWAAVTGTLTRPETVPPPNGTVVVVLAQQQPRTTYTATVASDGKFRFPAVTAGSYQMVARVPEGYYLRGIEVSGAPWKNGAIELNAGDTPALSLTLSDGASRVSGTATRDGKPARSVLIVLYPVDGPSPALRAHGFQTASDGSFDLLTARAGTYYLFALENTGLEYQNPEQVRPYLERARLLQVEPGIRYREQVPLTALPPAQ